MDKYLKKEECCGCGACVDICPEHAVQMVRDAEGFAYPCVDDSACTHCGRCRKVCPMENRMTGKSAAGYAGAQAENEAIRNTGSSGGVFPILAEYVLKRQGVVYGAGYRDHMEAAHREASSMDQLEEIKKTKYVQSSMQGIYGSVWRRLEEGRLVLFCGTPCQTHALKLFLEKEYEKLILVDLVCYGVPSPGIWEDYVRYLEKKYHGKMTSFSFRDKRAQDNGHTCAYVIDGREYAGSMYRDRFCRLYFSNAVLRPSCYSCSFCTVDRDSDFTIGDFWGIEKVRPDMDDGMGTSMVIFHTDKAEKIWEQVQEKMNWFACGKKDILQPRLQTPSPAAENRELVMHLYRRLPFSVFIKVVDAVCRREGRKSRGKQGDSI